MRTIFRLFILVLNVVVLGPVLVLLKVLDAHPALIGVLAVAWVLQSIYIIFVIIRDR